VAILIIGGMHRSGTTLSARWLYNCGLFIGDDFMTSKYDHANPDGQHYEDVAFLELHRAILRANQLDTDGLITDEPVHVPESLRERALQLAAQRQQNHQHWGWKEPRTCLFLDFWNSILPAPYLLIIYRSYDQVADSLLRRKLDHPRAVQRVFYRLKYHNHDNYVAHYIRVWTRYNQALLSAAAAAPERSLVLNIADLASHSSAIIAFLNEVWGFDLAPYAISNIYEPSRMKKTQRYLPAHTAELEQARSMADIIDQHLETERRNALARLQNIIVSGS
jgi:hypothetical protein